MRTAWFIPLSYLIFAAISLTVLQSIEPQLVANQAFFFLVGGVVIFVTSKISLSWWKIILPFAYLMANGLLIFTLMLGNLTRGTVSWIPIGPFHIQPSQIALPITLILLSYWIHKTSLQKISQIAIFFLIALIPFGLIFLEPDLGTGMVFLLSVFVLFALSPVNKKIVAISVISSLLVGIVAWTFLLKPYQRERVTSFLSPGDLLGAGYNSYQSLIAVGSGQIAGRGLGHGIQSQLRFLPEHQTDFIFASIAEETGFLGTSFVLAVYFFVLFKFTSGIKALRSKFAKNVTISFTLLIFFQMMINVGMNVGLLPITGITLPLLSYGGSSILSFSLMLGVLLNIFSRAKRWKSVVIS